MKLAADWLVRVLLWLALALLLVEVIACRHPTPPPIPFATPTPARSAVIPSRTISASPTVTLAAPSPSVTPSATATSPNVTATATPTPAVNRAHRFLVIPVEFDNWRFPYTREYVEQNVVYAVGVWDRFFGDTSFTYDIIWPPFHVAGNVPSCDMSFQAATVKTVEAAGHYGQPQMLGPAPPQCGYRTNATYFNVPTEGLGTEFVHEKGHLLGLAHTSSLPIQSLPADLDAAYAAANPWPATLEYGACVGDVMSEGNTPGYPRYERLSGYDCDLLHIPTKLVFSLRRGQWTYLVYQWGDSYEVSYVGPYRLGGLRNYCLGNFDSGDTWEDVTGGAPLVTIAFGPNGQVSAR